ncbi:phage minor capsid protein [Salinithrix halophila]|uniref:Phage minor capsid protein n=1 Tax=Salinithrix halophila TaxID=1485204 RepID=A0ABV8J9I4_9BACL
MPITLERLQQLSQPLINLYNQIQTEMLISIAKRLKSEEGRLVDNVIKWQANKLNQLGGLTKENITILARMAGIGPRDFMNLLREAGVEGIGPNESLLAAALRKGAPITEPPPPVEDPTITRILETYEKQATDTLNLVNSTLLSQSQQVYRDIINHTTAEVLAGTKTPKQAIRSTIKQWARQGIPALIDKAGRKWSAEGYVSMVVRTMSSQITNEMQDARFGGWGVDLVEVSSHAGARPKCAPYQGRIYSRSGRTQGYPTLADTSRGQPDGLFGINCGHFQYPFFPGISQKRYNRYPKEENDRAYKNSQIQRRLERAIRQAKTEARMLEAAGDEEGAKEARKLVRARQARMRKFIEETGRTRRRDREQIHS